MLKQCEKCGKFFGAEDDRTLCEECEVPEALASVYGLSFEEKKYELAKSIVYDKPDISPESLIKEMRDQEVPISLGEIMTYVKEGKMELKGAENGIFCEDCGKKILSGRKCPACTRKVETQITSGNTPEEDTPKKTETKKSEKMHVNR